MSEGEYRDKFLHLKLDNPKNKLCTVRGSRINEVGSVKGKVVYGGEEHVLRLIIIKGDKSTRCIVGRSWIDCLYPNWRNTFDIDHVNQVSSSSSFDITKEIQQHFPGVTEVELSSPIIGYEADIEMIRLQFSMLRTVRHIS